MEEEIILEILAEKAYNTYYASINSRLERFDREDIRNFSNIPKTGKIAWMDVIKEIIESYPTMNTISEEENLLTKKNN